ncbi:MAG: hypothetical protein ACKVS9_13410 [Phycisphaerae bacterium]
MTVSVAALWILVFMLANYFSIRQFTALARGLGAAGDPGEFNFRMLCAFAGWLAIIVGAAIVGVMHSVAFSFTPSSAFESVGLAVAGLIAIFFWAYSLTQWLMMMFFRRELRAPPSARWLGERGASGERA